MEINISVQSPRGGDGFGGGKTTISVSNGSAIASASAQRQNQSKSKKTMKSPVRSRSCSPAKATPQNQQRSHGQKREPIFIRKARIKHMFTGRDWRDDEDEDCEEDREGQGQNRLSLGRRTSSTKMQAQLNGECLMDAFFVLYEQCLYGQGDWNGKEPHVKYFLNKFGRVVSDLKKLRVNTSDFKFIELIGQGKYGKVYSARERSGGGLYAIKMLNKLDPQIQKMYSSMNAELDVLSKSSSEWLLSLKYSFQDPTKIYFVTEHVPGGDFLTHLQRTGGQLSEEAARFYLAELILAMNALHVMGFVHRDIKPENVLLDCLGHIKLADFGAASWLDSKGKVTTPFIVGLPNYIAPEVLQTLENDEEITSQFCYGTECDFWSAGVMAYEMVFGKAPFLGDNNLATFNNIISFKESLVFPPNSKVSQDCIDFIKGLLSAQTVRLDYSEALRHPFFNSIIWDTIRTDPAPYVPRPQSEHKTPDPTAKLLNQKNTSQKTDCETNGKPPLLSIPFLGFTRTFHDGNICNLSRTRAGASGATSFLEMDSADNSFFTEDKDPPDLQQSCLKAELNQKTELLREKTSEIQQLESKLTSSSDTITLKDEEIAKLSGELKKFQCERDHLASELEAERENFQNLEQKIRSLQSSQETKQNDLLQELQFQKTIVAGRDNEISKLKAEVKELKSKKEKSEVRKANQSAANVELENSVTSAAEFARNYRGSISLMESRLNQNSQELEEKIDALNKSHDEELAALQNALITQGAEFKEKNAQLSSDLATLQGRLEEARNARDAALEEMRQMRKKYSVTIKNLEETLEEVMKRNAQEKQDELEAEAVETISQLSDLEEKLEQTIGEKHRLSIRIEAVEKESKDKEEKIVHLDSIVRRLEETLLEIEKQRADMIANTQDFLKKAVADHDSTAGHSEATQILQSQLVKCQASWDLCKEDLYTTKERARQLESTIAILEKDLNSTRVDLRITQRENSELEAKITKHTDESKEISEKVKGLEEEKKELEKRVTNMSSEIATLQGKNEEEKLEKEQQAKNMEEKLLRINELEGELTNAKTEITNFQTKIEELEKIRRNFDEGENALKEMKSRIAEKDRKITQLLTNLEILKDAVALLETQLHEFEDAFAKKNKQFEEVVKQKAILESEKAAKIDELQAVKVELNEALSMKSFTQKKLEGIESCLTNVETSSQIELQGLKDKLDEMTQRNRLLWDELNNKSANYEETAVAKENLQKALENMRQDNARMKEDSSRIIHELVKLKTSNKELTEALQMAHDRVLTYRTKMESALADKTAMEEEMSRKELVLQSALNQHAKLVDYLRMENDQLQSAKKKKGFTGWIFGRDDAPGPQTSTPVPNLNKTDIVQGATPRRIMREHYSVNNLEDEAHKMKRQLETLKAKKMETSKPPFITRKENISPERIRIETCILLKEEEETTTSSSSTEISSSSGTSGTSESEPNATAMSFNNSGKSASSGYGVIKYDVFTETGESRLDINCAAHMLEDIYLLGCKEGLFSTRVLDDRDDIEESSEKVRIGGVDAVYQIELLLDVNHAIMIEGEDRELISVHLGLLRACAEAAACSKPKVQIRTIAELENCVQFKTKQTANGTTLVVTTRNTLNILFWEKNDFILKQSLKVNNVSGLCITPDSVLFGCDNEKVYEIDLMNFSVEEFMDESDQTLGYILATHREDPTFLLGILDVGRSGLRPGETTYTSEYLLCFPDVGVFVDTFGRRSRPLNLIWSKVPIDVVYCHPFLYIMHFGSVEVIRLSFDSYTTNRVGLSKSSLGELEDIIPESRFLQLNNLRLLGNGHMNGSIIIGSFDKSSTEVIEISCEDRGFSN